MGYTTEFEGRFTLNKPLDQETFEFLTKLATTRRMKRNVDAKYGVEGEFYVDGTGDYGQDKDATVVNQNQPPKTQPGLWCQWIPTKDKLGIEWDGGEKFYEYEAWLKYIIKNILAPKGYVLAGEVRFRGEDFDDFGTIIVENNKASVAKG